MTDHAVALHCIAVQFNDLFAACRLMQPVNILRDDCTQLPLFFPFCELQMCRIRFCLIAQNPFSLKPEEFLRVVFQQPDTEIGFRRQTVFLPVKPLFPAKIRKSALC